MSISLLLDEDQEELRADAREFAEEVIYYTYNSDHINRYFSEDYIMAFKESLFDCKEVQLTFPTQPSAEMQAALKQANPGYEQFANNGIFALLTKQSESLPIYF